MGHSGGIRTFVCLAGAFACLAGAATAAAEPQGRLTAHLGGEPAPALPALRTGMAETYAGDGRLTYRPIQELLPEAVEDATATLKKADDDLEEGDKAFSGMDIEPAKQHLTAAVAAYSAWLPELIKRDGKNEKLLTAWVLLAKSYFFDGDNANTKVALRHCLTLDPNLNPKGVVFPPQMKRVVTEVRSAYDVAGLGKLSIETKPRGATIYVDGIARPGMSPMTLEIESGPHDVRLDLAGHKRAVESAEVPGGGSVDLSAALPEAPSRADGARRRLAGARPGVAAGRRARGAARLALRRAAQPGAQARHARGRRQRRGAAAERALFRARSHRRRAARRAAGAAAASRHLRRKVGALSRFEVVLAGGRRSRRTGGGRRRGGRRRGRIQAAQRRRRRGVGGGVDRRPLGPRRRS